jgi:hypothetical protein
MAEIKVPTRVTAPDEITIQLVRGDHITTSNVFRVCFEVSLALFSALLGTVLDEKEIQRLQWAGLVVLGVATGTFLILSIAYHRKASSQAGR